jgi:hypothetical protein
VVGTLRQAILYATLPHGIADRSCTRSLEGFVCPSVGVGDPLCRVLAHKLPNHPPLRTMVWRSILPT